MMGYWRYETNPETSFDAHAGPELDQLYCTTTDPRLRTRAQMIFLAAEPGLTGPQMAAIVREREATGLRWLKRDRAEGVGGWQDMPRPGRPSQITAASRRRWLNRHAPMATKLGVTGRVMDVVSSGRLLGRTDGHSGLG